MEQEQDEISTATKSEATTSKYFDDPEVKVKTEADSVKAEDNPNLEVEALIGQTQAFGREHQVPTPTIDVILPLLRGLQHGLQRA